MKKLMIFVLMCILCSVWSSEGSAISNRTGMRLVSAGLSGIVYFNKAQSTSERFSAKYLYLELDKDATGTIKISRWIKSGGAGGALVAIDDSLACILEPGQRRILVGDGVAAFRYVRTVATDRIIYDASDGDVLPAEWNSIEGTSINISDPIPVAVTPAFSIFSGYEMIPGTNTTTVFNKTQRTNPRAGALCLDGVQSVLLQFSWTLWNMGGFAYQVKYGTHSADTGVVMYGGTTWCDSIGFDTLDAGYANIKRSGGTLTRLLTDLPGAGYLFVTVWPHGAASIHIHGLSCTARVVE